MTTLDPRSILTRHGIPAFVRDDLSAYLTTIQPDMSRAARTWIRRPEFRAAAKEWRRAASAQFVRELKGGAR